MHSNNVVATSDSFRWQADWKAHMPINVIIIIDAPRRDFWATDQGTIAQVDTNELLYGNNNGYDKFRNLGQNPTITIARTIIASWATLVVVLEPGKRIEPNWKILSLCACEPRGYIVFVPPLTPMNKVGTISEPVAESVSDLLFCT